MNFDDVNICAPVCVRSYQRARVRAYAPASRSACQYVGACVPICVCSADGRARLSANVLARIRAFVLGCTACMHACRCGRA